MKNEKCKLQSERGRRSSFCLFLFSLFIFHSLFLGSVSAQTLESTESRFLSGLRERRLFELAESHGRRQLAEAYSGKRRKAEATIELSRTLLEWALYSKPPMRDERFAAAMKVLDELRFDAAD